MEKAKTIFLVSLVALSLLQSYLLVFRSPNFDEVSTDEYLQAEPIGSQETVEELLFPAEIVLHLGDGEHTVLYPGIHYDLIFQRVKQRTFDGFRRNYTQMLNSEWEDIRNNQIGVELRFRNGIPLNILQRIMQIRGDLPTENNTITRIWFFSKDGKEDVKTFFFTDNPFVIYEATRADLNIKDVETSIGFGQIQTLYHTVDGDYYLPDQPLPAVKLTMPYEKLTGPQLQNSFFVDPGNTRNFRDRDGSDIYTDGKRGLQIKNERSWMSYSDPIPQVESRNDVSENLHSAVQFINQHGGWNGQYAASRVPLTPPIGRQNFRFRQYVNSFPIIAEESEHLGIIRIVLQKGVVSGYERSLVQMDVDRAERTEWTLPGGKELDEMIARYPRRAQVVSVLPAYRPTVSEENVTLEPGWVAELRDGTYEYLK